MQSLENGPGLFDKVGVPAAVASTTAWTGTLDAF